MCVLLDVLIIRPCVSMHPAVGRADGLLHLQDQRITGSNVIPQSNEYYLPIKLIGVTERRKQEQNMTRTGVQRRPYLVRSMPQRVLSWYHTGVSSFSSARFFSETGRLRLPTTEQQGVCRKISDRDPSEKNMFDLTPIRS